MIKNGTRTMANHGRLKQVMASTPITEHREAKKMLSMNGCESSIVYISLEIRFMIRPLGVVSKNLIDAFTKNENKIHLNSLNLNPLS